MNKPNRRPHAAHTRGRGAPSAEELLPSQLPSYLLQPETDEVRELLEELDDAVFAAIAGSEPDLDRAKKLWPKALREIESELVEESREQYLRFAVEAARKLDERDSHSPENAIAAIEVITLLTTE